MTLSFVVIVFSPINVTTDIGLRRLFVVVFVTYIIHVFVQPIDEGIISETLLSYMGSTLIWLGAARLALMRIWFNRRIGYNTLEATSLLMSLLIDAIVTLITDEEASVLSINECDLQHLRQPQFTFMGFLFCRLWSLSTEYLIHKPDTKIWFQGIHDLEEDEDTWPIHKRWII